MYPWKRTLVIAEGLGVYIFPKNISPKVKITARLEFEHIYFEITVQNFSCPPHFCLALIYFELPGRVQIFTEFVVHLLIIILLIIITWSKSPQVTGTLHSTLTVLNNAIVWMVSTRSPTSKSSSPFNNPLVTVPKAPITSVTYYYYYYYYYFTHFRVYNTSVSWWFSPGMCVTPSLQKSSNYLNNAVVLMVSTHRLISRSFSSCTNPLVTLPSTPINIGITVTFMFYHIFF